MDAENEVFEFPEEEGISLDMADSKALLNTIKEIHTLLKKISTALGAKYPAPSKTGYPYPYPKKLQAWIESPEEFSKFEKELEKKEQDYQMKIEELQAKIKEFEDEAKKKKISELLDMQAEKGLITPEMREELFKNYESFSLEQIESIAKNIEQMNFSQAKAKSMKNDEIPEAESKDFAKRREELITKIKDLETANVRGPIYEQYKKELEELTK